MNWRSRRGTSSPLGKLQHTKDSIARLWTPRTQPRTEPQPHPCTNTVPDTDSVNTASHLWSQQRSSNPL